MGLFSRKPSKREQALILGILENFMPFFMHLAENRNIQVPGGPLIDLNDIADRSHLVAAIETVLNRAQLQQIPPDTREANFERAEVLSQLENLISSDPGIDPFLVPGLKIVQGLNAFEFLAYNHQQFPKFALFRELVGGSTFTISRALMPVSGGDLNQLFRGAFPRLFVASAGFTLGRGPRDSAA